MKLFKNYKKLSNINENWVKLTQRQIEECLNFVICLINCLKYHKNCWTNFSKVLKGSG